MSGYANHHQSLPNLKSTDLSQRLAEVVQKHKRRESEYRHTNQKFWTIAFIDISSSAERLWDFGESIANTILDYYQRRVRSILQYKDSCFIEPGGGPQIVCCFEDPGQAAMAMDLVLQGMDDWNREQDENLRIVPAIGLHQGFVHYIDGTIHQSNTNNMAKRIQTQAAAGQVFISSDLEKVLHADPRFQIEFSHTAELKNIPEPQDIYEIQVVRLRESVDFNALPEPVMETTAVQVEGDESLLGRQEHQWILIYIDVTESTKKFWKYGDREARELIREYQKLCERTFERSGSAFVTSSEGDQIFAGFEVERSNDAVQAAIKILQDLFSRNIHVPQNRQVRAAAGMHFGEAIVQDGALVQTKDMRVGKTIQSEAGADDLLLSQKVVSLLPERWKTELKSLDIDDTDRFDEQQLYRLQWFNLRNQSERPQWIDPNRRKSF